MFDGVMMAARWQWHGRIALAKLSEGTPETDEQVEWPGNGLEPARSSIQCREGIGRDSTGCK